MQDLRIKNLLESGRDQVKDPSFVMVGCPVDEGVERNGGRKGAAQAPSLIRKYLNKMTPPASMHERFSDLISGGIDLGDIEVKQMEAMQQNLGDVIAPWLEKDVPVIILGGGHETSYGHYLGYRKAQIAHHVLNLDAHADVRPLNEGKGHSGSPFRQIMDDRSALCQGYRVAGLQPQSVAHEHVDFIKSHEGSCFFIEDTDISLIENLYSNAFNTTFATFDMDAVDQSLAPGVSAPCPHGVSKSLWLQAAFLAGKNPKVTSMDLVEINPEYDQDDHTLRLGALTIWNFLCGLSIRNV